MELKKFNKIYDSIISQQVDVTRLKKLDEQKLQWLRNLNSFDDQSLALIVDDIQYAQTFLIDFLKKYAKPYFDKTGKVYRNCFRLNEVGISRFGKMDITNPDEVARNTNPTITVTTVKPTTKWVLTPGPAEFSSYNGEIKKGRTDLIATAYRSNPYFRVFENPDILCNLYIVNSDNTVSGMRLVRDKSADNYYFN